MGGTVSPKDELIHSILAGNKQQFKKKEKTVQ